MLEIEELLLDVGHIETVSVNVAILELDTEPDVVFDNVGVLVCVLLAVCDTEIVEVVDTDELSDIQPE